MFLWSLALAVLARPSPFPFESALLDLVEKAEDEHAQKKENRPQNRDVIGEKLAVNKGPRHEDHDLQIEQHEKQSRNVKFDGESGVNCTIRRNTTLVRGIFDLRVSRTLPEKLTRCDHTAGNAG